MGIMHKVFSSFLIAFFLVSEIGGGTPIPTTTSILGNAVKPQSLMPPSQLNAPKFTANAIPLRGLANVPRESLNIPPEDSTESIVQHPGYANQHSDDLIVRGQEWYVGREDIPRLLRKMDTLGRPETKLELLIPPEKNWEGRQSVVAIAGFMQKLTGNISMKEQWCSFRDHLRSNYNLNVAKRKLGLYPLDDKELKSFRERLKTIVDRHNEQQWYRPEKGEVDEETSKIIDSLNKSSEVLQPPKDVALFPTIPLLSC
ncbi:hypothetical protein H0H93_011204 [Arthromyces matolae]|nr:hypothetical protein H0H93_011204 [Arthromyces matolae]